MHKHDPTTLNKVTSYTIVHVHCYLVVRFCTKIKPV